jgi:4-diphosphocytidyl-2-C-methyl-D-erythritol kinase
MAEHNTSIFAPAKINLYLHVTGKRADGYHDLDSLVVFADIGDQIRIDPAKEFSLRIIGPYASAFSAQDRDSSPASGNLIARAAYAMAEITGRNPHFMVTLTKNLPLAAGVGGGSADAAAMIWGLMDQWNIPISAPFLPDMMRNIGADIPACLRCSAVRMSGTGDVLEHIPDLPEIPVVLVNPGKHCPTPSVFKTFIGPMRGDVVYPPLLPERDAFIDFINAQENDLTPSAMEIVPDIRQVIDVLRDTKGCRVARMTGSGASVFGLFPNRMDAQQAAERITLDYPRWWVRTGTINSPERY